MSEKNNSVYKNSIGKKNANRDDVIANLTALLTLPQNKEFKHDTLKELKGAKGRELLIEAIEYSTDNNTKRVLFTACWESGNDFSAYLPFFVSHIPFSDLETTLDIYNVIEEMQGPFEAKLINECIATLMQHNTTNDDAKKAIVSDVINHLNIHL